VRRHPEITDVLQSLAAGESSSASAYDSLARIVGLYLPASASDERAKLLGNYIGMVTFCSNVRTLAHLVQNARQDWAKQNDLPASVHSTAWAVATLLMAASLEVEDAAMKLDLKRAEDILYQEQLKRRFAVSS